MSNSDAEQQLSTIAGAKEKGPDSLIRLPWIVLIASDVLFARTADVPGEPTPSTPSPRTAKKAAARRTPRAAKK